MPTLRSAATLLASACALVRGSRSAGSPGSIVASTVTPASTTAPAFSPIRDSRPASGADTTYRSLIRVCPSSSTVTRIGPRSTAATSTSTGRGHSA